MSTWTEYLQNSFGIKIAIAVCLLLTVNIMISRGMEKKRLEAGLTQDDKKVKSIVALRRLWTGMLIGFVVSIVAGVAQFIVRFGYFSLFQEIGAVFLGFIGAVIGALLGIIQWRHRST